jgi:nickel/cobalt exporter
MTGASKWKANPDKAAPSASCFPLRQCDLSNVPFGFRSILSMSDFAHALQSGAAHLWLFIPSAILLGALHGLEPGHSKTMMAAFIVAIRGTVWQAVLLGLSAAISHSLIIWLFAALALNFGSQWNAERAEPYLQLASAACILGLAIWMYLRTRRELTESHHHGHSHVGAHNHAHEHGHHHEHDERVLVSTGHGTAELSIFEKDSPPVFRLAFTGEPYAPRDFAVETVRGDGTRQIFVFAAKDGFFESTTDIPEPHEFNALVTFTHRGHEHTARVEFREGDAPRVSDEAGEYQDAHERAHAIEIAQRFAGRNVTTPQIVLFGVTGGLMPCPAAFTVLLVCLQLKRVTLGFAMVAAFSLGLALTMVATGTIAALSVRHAEKRFRGFGEAMRRAPYVSCALLVFIASYMAWHGWRGLAGHS